MEGWVGLGRGGELRGMVIMIPLLLGWGRARRAKRWAGVEQGGRRGGDDAGEVLARGRGGGEAKAGDRSGSAARAPRGA